MKKKKMTKKERMAEIARLVALPHEPVSIDLNEIPVQDIMRLRHQIRQGIGIFGGDPKGCVDILNQVIAERLAKEGG